jgi:hypothetical protein
LLASPGYLLLGRGRLHLVGQLEGRNKEGRIEVSEICLFFQNELVVPNAIVLGAADVHGSGAHLARDLTVGHLVVDNVTRGVPLVVRICALYPSPLVRETVANLLLNLHNEVKRVNLVAHHRELNEVLVAAQSRSQFGRLVPGGSRSDPRDAFVDFIEASP